MPTLRLNEKAIARLPAPDPDGKPVLHWDSELKGFGVLCSGTSNAKSYIVQHALRDGTRRRVTIARTNVLTLDEAIVQAKRLLSTFYAGRDPKNLNRNDPTLKQVLADYVAARRDLKPRSTAYYEDTVNRHLASWLDLPMRSITREMVEEKLLKIAKDVASATEGRHSGNAAANGAMRSFRALFNFASDRAPADNPFPNNPVRLKKIWLPVTKRSRKVQTSDMAKFYRAVCELANPVAADYLKVLLFTGMRRREAAGLRWTDIDTKQKIVKVPADATKPGRALDLPMSDFLFDLLTARRAVGDTRWIFPANSKSGHLEEPKSFLKEIAMSCGVLVSAHDLRRTFTSTAESLNLNAYVLKALINHSLGDGVTEGYIVMDPERLREPVQQVADRLKLLCGIASAKKTNSKTRRKRTARNK